MRRNDFIEQVERIGCFDREAHAEAAIEATLSALGALLLPSERRVVSERLPKELRGFLDVPEHAPDLDLERFYERVQRHERVPAGRAREHAQIVCRALANAVGPDVVWLLMHHLPSLEVLFREPEQISTPPEPEHPGRPAPANTLATGRPGSRHPLSSSRPERAHSHSVARSEDPHGDTKLSASRGLTQEREEETLAAGRLPKRP